MAARPIRIGDPDYPSRLHALSLPPKAAPPESVNVEGNFEYDERKLHIAIVGSRECHPAARDFAFLFARCAAQSGAIVLSGGAFGVDTAAHEGAMAGGGVTWSVLGCGWPHIHPSDNADLFSRILESGGVLIRPFEDDARPANWRFLHRNRVLVALAQAVLVVQAGFPSGALSSAQWALKLGRELWVVPGALAHRNIKGTVLLLKDPRTHVVTTMNALGEHFGIDVPDPDLDLDLNSDSIPISDPDSDAVSVSISTSHASDSDPDADLSDDEKTLLHALSFTPKHPDQLVSETGLSASAVSTALLTLALGDVVVEGSSGLFQRKKLVRH